MKKQLLVVLASGALLVGMVGTAFAVPITGLYNTGEGHSSPTSSVPDSYYDVIASPGSVALGDASVYKSGVFPVSTNWLADNATSSWIGPVNLAGNSTPGTYIFETTFNVNRGYDLKSLEIIGRWMTDNSGTQILLNGHNLTGTTAHPINNPSGFVSTNDWATFDITQDYFNLGTNTLDFVVSNYTGASGNPTGLRVEFLSETGAQAPEPGTMMLLGMGMLGLAVYGKRKMNKEA
jgi:PEP-CTERM motif